MKIGRDSEGVVLGPAVGEGASAIATRSVDGRFIIKSPRPSDEDLDFSAEICRETLILTYLERAGMNSDVPKVYEVSTGSARCDAMVMAIENVGPYMLADLLTTDGSFISDSPSLLYRIAARLLDIVKNLYTARIVHGDLHSENIMFSSPIRIARSIKLIDFGRSEPLLGDLWPLWTDLTTLLYSLNELGFHKHRGRNPVIARVEAQFAELDDDATTIPFDEWINYLRTAAVESKEISIVNDSAELTAEGLIGILTHRPSLASHLVNAKNLRECRARTSKDFEVIVSSAFNFNENERTKLADIWLAENVGLPTYTVPHTEEEICSRAIILTRPDRLPLSTLIESISSTTSVVLISNLTVRAIELLKTIHGLGVVHPGDYRRDLTYTSGDVSFESLAFARTGSMTPFTTELRRCPLHPNAVLKGRSPGELIGYCPSVYDDLYRLSELFVLMFFDQPVKWTEMNVKGILRTKRDSLKLTANDTFLYSLLNEFHNEMFHRSFNRDTYPPDYDGWINRFRSLTTMA